MDLSIFKFFKRKEKSVSVFERQYAFVVEKAKARFPDLTVYGQVIQDGKGYGIFFNNGVKQSCWQVRACIGVNGKQIISDILAVKDIDKAIEAAFEAVSIGIYGKPS